MLPAEDPVPLPRGSAGARGRRRPPRLDGSRVLDGVTLRIAPEESVAIVGQTGGGKSTLAQLLVRLADPDDGVVRVGGVDLRHAEPASLREAVSIVFQESFLFSTTIGENIALDSGADDDAVERAARIAAVDRFVRNLPEGFETVVGERGHTLSGGERQRVALARAIVREPRALILDDATSSVDPSIEASILSALREELHTTLVVIAYRLSTIRLADRVVFLDRGRVAATGTHDELMATAPATRRSSGPTSGASDDHGPRAAVPGGGLRGPRGAPRLVRGPPARDPREPGAPRRLRPHRRDLARRRRGQPSRRRS